MSATIPQRNVYRPDQPLHDLDGWIVFYGKQANRLQDDRLMAEVFQASCETAQLLLELMKEWREKNGAAH